MISEKILQYVGNHEGLKLKMYKDSLGIWTIGYGHNLNRPISKRAARVILEDDAHDTEVALQDIQWYNDLDPIRQIAIFDMAYNMGIERLLGFREMIAGIKAKDWQKAHDEALDSEWDKEVGAHRANQDANILLTGEMP